MLLIDHSPPPADTLSTHFLYPNTIARLRELGAIDRIEKDHRLNPLSFAVHALGHDLEGGFTPIDGVDWMCSVTRPVLDRALLETAVESGAETRFGHRVTGLVRDGDRVRGISLENGEDIRARWVIGADGRASTVAAQLDLQKERPMAAEMAFMFAYWRGLPQGESFELDIREDAALTWTACEDDLSILLLGLPPEATRGDEAQRRGRYFSSLERFGDRFDLSVLERGEEVSPIRIVPESMLRGFFRTASGPGWALVGDAGHFKHPSTAQGISDAIEQSLYVADALSAPGEDLTDYGRWRDERAEEHYEWSFAYGQFPTPEIADPLFGGLTRDPAAAADFRDSFSRLRRPRSEVFTPERMGEWFGQRAA